jgi:hypothetical protein
MTCCARLEWGDAVQTSENFVQIATEPRARSGRGTIRGVARSFRHSDAEEGLESARIHRSYAGS